MRFRKSSLCSIVSSSLYIPRDNDNTFRSCCGILSELSAVVDYVRKFRERRLVDIDFQTMLR